jgi:3-hydroxybutyrate dehydrogenase
MLKGKCALVTGSTQGMGLATATVLASRGCNVMLHGLADPKDAEEKRQKIAAAYGIKAGFHGANLSRLDEIEDLVRATEQALGSVDILVNNAVTRHRGLLEDIPVEKWNEAIAVNLSAPFHLIRLTLPGMKRRRWGRIISIASNWGLTGTKNRGDYVATKHGLVGLMRAAALETLEFGITCNAIAPGSTLTPHAERQLRERMEQSGKTREEAMKDFFMERQPSGRFVMPEHVGELIAFLCTDAAREMTGTPISIDGGWLAM